ncbi:MAG: hypothetical protein K0R18_2555, partial [Bacillales bacterium]|nr:hypothetical protein [Bacillales bacterium]
EAQKAKNGSQVFIYCAGEKKVALNSLISPDKEMDRFLKEMEGETPRFITIIGIGNGTVIEKLIQSSFFETNVHFLIIEPFENVSLQENTKQLLNKYIAKVSFYYLNDFSANIFNAYLSKFIAIQSGFYIHPNYLRANKSKVEEVIRICKEGITTKEINNNTQMLFAVDWIVEPLLNTKAMERSINLENLKNKFEGETALLISAGPSLHENMSFVKKMQKSAHIFAVGPTLRPLLKNNIHPDYVLSMDAGEVNYEYHFKDLSFNGTLIYTSISNHQIQEQHNGLKVVSKMGNEQVSSMLYKDVFGFPSRPSVAIYALEVIKYLGFKEVYLVGQDLALKNGEYYAKGVKQHNKALNVKAELVVENNAGQYIETTNSLKNFLNNFEELIKSFSQGEMKIFNISKYGAKIKGTEFIEPDFVLMDTVKNSHLFDKNFNTPKQPVLEFINEFINRLEQIKKNVAIANKEINAIIKSRNMKPKQQKKMLKTFKKISNNELIEKIILKNITNIFNGILNKIIYAEEKNTYTNDDLLTIANELSKFYGSIYTYLEFILNDTRVINIKTDLE